MVSFSVFLLLLVNLCKTFANGIEQPRYLNMPMHEIIQSTVYVHTNSFDEVVVAFADKGCELKTGDYITHTDGIKVLNGGLSSFLKNGEKEAVVPVVDENDSKYGGFKLIGFVMMQPVTPRKLSSRRGEVGFDLEEGGPAPTMKLGNIVMGPGGVKSTSDPDYDPPPHGGGPCITGRDCYYHNGTCIEGQCRCSGPYTGTFCQLDRPEVAAISKMIKKTQALHQQRDGKQPPTGVQIPIGTKTGNEDEIYKFQHEMLSNSLSNANSAVRNEPMVENIPLKDTVKPAEELPRETLETPLPAAPTNVNANVNANNDQEGVQNKKGRKKRKPHPKQRPEDSMDNNHDHEEAPPQKQVTVDDMYGANKAYPEPYTAGRLPSNILRERHLQRSKREMYVYSVRFRTGPLGIVFDNKIQNGTLVEKLVKGQQAELSDIRNGDRLLAIDTFNVTGMSAKLSQRILSDLSWPKILVFEARFTGEDPDAAQSKVASRSFNITILYPPSLVGEYSFRLSDWTQALNIRKAWSDKIQQQVNMKFTESSFCPIFKLKSVEDSFGCDAQQSDYRLPSFVDHLVDRNGFASEEEANESPFLSILLREAFQRRIIVEPRSLAIVKRGLCTFVEKAKLMVTGNANLGLVVNTDNEIIDMPSGKEKTQECTVPFGQFLQLAARTNDIWAVVTSTSDQDKESNAPCESIIGLAEDLVDKWPHSVPAMSVSQIAKAKPPNQNMIRGLTDEGGRLALSGENGWAFFDYHLAMFGPQDVPLGPFRFVMAMPPFGCDPNTYTVRITDAVVAILRGGGCSFGIKVINAQKLGAKAVVIVNTDDMKTMRLMALPDEIPLIKIPCIMVSRRIQYYFEEQLKPYYPLDQHIVSIQPTGIFGDYEQKNTVALPMRLGK